MIGKGSPSGFLSADEVRQLVASTIEEARLDGLRVLVIVPDGTRTAPIPQLFSLFQELLRPRASALDFLVALGTHPLMSDAQLSRLIGATVVDGRSGQSHIFNHHWEKPETFVELGVIPRSEIEQLSRGLMSEDVPVRLNRLILDYDRILICGPVFPHEVVGFSGGNKYLFPGIAGAEIINFTHWLGAVITNCDVIGTGYTAVRAVIDRAARMVPKHLSCLAMVVTHEGLRGLYFGDPAEAWTEAAALSSQVHVRWVEKPYRRVLSIMPELYDDLWTAAKGMYKMEPAVADGGEVVIYSPRVTEVSYTHGKLIDEIGYHCRDYFLKQWPRFKHYPGGVLAHSTHVKGLGSYDAASAVESPRIQVTLATGIRKARCERINLGYLDPLSINIEDWRNRQDEGVLVVDRAGEILYRLARERAQRLEPLASGAELVRRSHELQDGRGGPGSDGQQPGTEHGTQRLPGCRL